MVRRPTRSTLSTSIVPCPTLFQAGWVVQDPVLIRYRMEWPRWRPAPIDADGAAYGTARVGRRDEPAARIRVDPGARRRRSGATLLLGGCRRRVPSPSGAHLWLRDRRHAPEIGRAHV